MTEGVSSDSDTEDENFIEGKDDDVSGDVSTDDAEQDEVKVDQNKAKVYQNKAKVDHKEVRFDQNEAKVEQKEAKVTQNEIKVLPIANGNFENNPKVLLVPNGKPDGSRSPGGNRTNPKIGGLRPTGRRSLDNSFDKSFDGLSFDEVDSTKDVNSNGPMSRIPEENSSNKKVSINRYFSFDPEYLNTYNNKKNKISTGSEPGDKKGEEKVRKKREPCQPCKNNGNIKKWSERKYVE